MGLAESKKQWNEMNEVDEAIKEAENQRKNSSSDNKSLKNRIKAKVLREDPRSASEEVDRTPIAVKNGQGGADTDTPVKTMALIDPRSPGCVLGGEVVVERTPILVMQNKEETTNTPMRGSTIPSFSLAGLDTPNKDDVETPISDSPLVLKTKTMKTSTPTTIPTINSKAGQPSNLLQERLKEAASAAMKVENNDVTAPAADEFMERFETEEKIELKEGDGSENLVLSDNNDSSLVI